ncbi:MAG: hypothetical protein V1722_02205 [Candidatus Micrarchaeota archaeon]
MGILPFQSGRRNYLMELDYHGSKRKSELPVEKLNAVFLETGSIQIRTAKEAKTRLNKTFPKAGTEYTDYWKRTLGVINAAKKSGTEIWLGDPGSSNLELHGSTAVIAASAFLRAAGGLALLGPGGALAAAVSSPAVINGLWLQRSGNAKKRKISRAIISAIGKINPLVVWRNKVIAHKIQILAEKTGHTKIGILVGTGHVGLADHLEKQRMLTPAEMVKAKKRGAQNVKMFRCRFDKGKNEWQVEEHSI